MPDQIAQVRHPYRNQCSLPKDLRGAMKGQGNSRQRGIRCFQAVYLSHLKQSFLFAEIYLECVAPVLKE